MRTAFFIFYSMKITLINPPIEDFYITSVRRQPLGLLYIASVLVANGLDVELINCHTPKKHKLQIPDKFFYLQKFIGHKNPLYKFPFGLYQRFGMSTEAVREKIKKSKGEIFLISSLFSTYHEEVEDIISMVKKCHPGKIVVAGGYHPSLFPNKFIQRTEVDAVIVGEGEKGVLKLLSQVERGEFQRGCIIETREAEKKLDKLIFPDRSFLLERDFTFYKKRSTPIIGSRGCPNKCSFCTSRKFWDGHYAARSIENILEEIEQCIKNYNITHYNFEDDNLFINSERAVEFLESLIGFQEKNKIALDFSAMNGVSIEKLDKGIVKLMFRAGFKELNISLVTSSVRHQIKLDRPFSTFKFTEIAEASKKMGMNVRAYYILGLPKQEKNELLDTIKYLRDLEVQSFPSVYYNITDKEDEWKVQRSSAFYNETGRLSREDLIYLFNYNYLNY